MDDLKVLLKLARLSILEEFEKRPLIDKKEWVKKYPFLIQKRASFVTLKLSNNLRGCIGSILPNQSLIDDVIYNAKASAFKDPRFLPLMPEEFNNIKIEINLLTIPQKIEYENKKDLREKIKIGIDGIILQLANYQATFLPSVWEELPSFELFLLICV